MNKESSRDISFQNFTEIIGYQANTSHLLVIAIANYQVGTKLSNSIKDAEKFVDLMISQYQLEPKNITRLFNKDATLAGINKAFSHFTKTLKSPDNLIVFFAGHGKKDQGLGKGYWVPVNAKRQVEFEYFSYQTLEKYLNAINTQHTVVIAGSCYTSPTLLLSRDFSLSEQFPQNPPELFQEKTKENTSWKRAEKIDTLDSYEYFLSIYPDGVYSQQAKTKIYHIQEEEEWIGAHLADTLEAYESYLKSFPKGRYVTHALHAIAKKQERNAVVQNAVSQIKNKALEEVLTLSDGPSTAQKSTQTFSQNAEYSFSKNSTLITVAAIIFAIVGIAFLYLNN